VRDAEALLESMIKHPDYGEGVKAWMQKRSPDWKG
jgi:enoyl-CoA hydratase/carnithine racemase